MMKMKDTGSPSVDDELSLAIGELSTVNHDFPRVRNVIAQFNSCQQET